MWSRRMDAKGDIKDALAVARHRTIPSQSDDLPQDLRPEEMIQKQEESQKIIHSGSELIQPFCWDDHCSGSRGAF